MKDLETVIETLNRKGVTIVEICEAIAMPRISFYNVRKAGKERRKETLATQIMAAYGEYFKAAKVEPELEHIHDKYLKQLETENNRLRAENDKLWEMLQKQAKK